MNNSTQLSPTDKALQKVADLIIERMEALKSAQWSQPWFNNNYQPQFGISKTCFLP